LAKRLTEKQKEEIIKSFEFGKSIEFLSEKYKCTKLTIIRNLKKNLGELKYNELFNNRKSINIKSKTDNKQSNKIIKTNFINQDSKENKNDANISNFAPDDSFLEIAPINFDIDNSSRKDLSSVPISEVDFPKVVYMIVDKKIELEIKLLKDFPEWEFLPHEDLNRKTIEIFFDLKLAKKSCNRDQKVLKVPNTDVFRIASPILISKGISRIVFAESLIAL
tara:strand:- start:603 stop:1265 length:663 start_codon:yes stop_codon:yes gene_type:complete